MARETLDRQTKQLLDDVLVLGSMVEQAIIGSVSALKKRDTAAAQRIYDGDIKINVKRYEIEEATITTIATQQPLARDLRIMASVLEIISDLERIGDYAKGIAKICIMMGNQPPLKPLIDIPRMAEISADMLHRALTAFVELDVEQALLIPKEDDLVDALYNQVNRELITYVMADPSTIDRADFLQWVAHNLERMADRVANICERVYYVSSGRLMEMSAIYAEIESKKAVKE